MKHESTSQGQTMPFPALTRERIPCDPRLARTVCSSYYGELAAISGYIYRSIITEEDCHGLSELFERIAIDEMHHFRILGRLIRLLGGNPTVRTNLSLPSVPQCELSPLSSETARRLIEESIREEKAALAEYKRLANCSMGNTSAVFLRIAADEERHIRTLQEFSVR